MNKIRFISFLSFFFILAGCEDLPKPKPTVYSGYFRVLIKNDVTEHHNEHNQNYKHMLVQAIRDTFLYAELSQYDYAPLTDSLYYTSKSGDIIKLESVDKSFFIYGEKYFPMVKPQE